MTADGPLLAALDDFLALGFVVLQHTPTTPGTVLAIAGRFGYVRETNFGRLFDVRSYPNSNDLAYRPIPLGPHTDNPYRSPVPGIQLLHCLVNDTRAACRRWSTASRSRIAAGRGSRTAFELLATLPVRFRFRDADTELVSWQPGDRGRCRGVTTGLHYSPRLDEMPVMDDRHDPARTRRLAAGSVRLLVEPEYELRFRAPAGRVADVRQRPSAARAHGVRPQEGMRHLQGCYIDHDAPRSRYRVLRRRLDRRSEG